MKDNLHEEILRQLSLINFDRGKTLSENTINNNLIILKKENYNIISEDTEPQKTVWCDSKESAEVRGLLYDAGVIPLMRYGCNGGSNKYPYGYNNRFEALNDMALLVTRKLTETVYDAVGKGTVPAELQVSVLGGSGGTQKFTKFDDTMIDELKRQVQGAKEYRKVDYNKFETKKFDFGRKPFNTFVLRDFYFDFGKLQNSMGTNGQSYYFDPYPWTFFYKFFEGNAATALRSIQKVNMIYKPNVTNVKGSFLERLSGNYYKQGSAINKYSDIDNQIMLDFGQTTEGGPTSSEIVNALHWILPALSLISQFVNLGIPGLGVVLGSVFEIIDSGLYYLYDDDPYMAGISLIFALVPLNELRGLNEFSDVMKLATKGESEGEVIAKLLEKQKNTPKLLKVAERKFLKKISTDPKIKKIVINETLNQATSAVLKKAGSKGIIKLLGNLVENGLLKPSMLQTIIASWGGIYAFDYFAYENLGKCSSTFNIDELTSLMGVKTKNAPKDATELEKWYRDLINTTIKGLNPQPFTKSKTECEEIATVLMLKKQLAELEKFKDSNLKDIIIEYLNAMIKSNENINKKNKTQFSYLTLVCQIVLSNCYAIPRLGVGYEIENFYEKEKLFQTKNQRNLSKLLSTDKGNYNGSKITLKDVRSIEKIEILGNEGGILSDYSKVLDTLRPSKKNEVTSKKIMVGTGFKIRIDYGNNNIKTSEIIQTKPYLQSLSGIFNYGQATQRINWGYYDESTVILVEMFQSEKGLKETGDMDIETVKKLLEVVKNNSCGTIKNNSGKNIPITVNPYDLMTKAASDLQENWVEETRPTPSDELTPDQIKIINKYILIDSEDKLIKFGEAAEDSINESN